MKKLIFLIIAALAMGIYSWVTGLPDPQPLRESEQNLWWKSDFPKPTMKDQRVYDGVIDGFFLDAKWSVDIMEKIHPTSKFSLNSNGATVEYLVIEHDGKVWTKTVTKGEKLPLTGRPAKLYCKIPGAKQPSRESMWPRLIIVVSAPQ